jgi:chromosomal replication initiation ATPase DnaA
LLRAVLVKSFADRQLAVTEPILSYLVQRMPRSLDAARTIVNEIDNVALSERAELTRPFVARILSRMVNLELFDES